MEESWLATWGLFAGLMALGQFSPGPDMILLTRISLKEGCWAGWLAVLGIVSGLCIHAALAIGGVSALLGKGGRWESALSLFAAAYLFWLGMQMMKSFRLQHLELEVEDKSSRQGRWFLQGLLCNLLNPKVAVFFAGMTALFLKGDFPSWWPVLLWLTIVGEGLVLWGLWVVLLQRKEVRGFYQRQSKWLDFGFGLGLWIIGLLLLWSAF